MVTVEAIEWGYILHNNYERSKLASKAMLGIHQMWVHSKFRKQGIATRLIDVARERMVFSMVIPPELVAFSSPTEAGVKFATRYVSHVAADEKEVLVYDCS
jgi:N-acetyltransferase